MNDHPLDRAAVPRPRQSAARRLICLSFSGAGTAPFHSWADVLPPEVELVAVCYPGRGIRCAEPCARSWDELVADAGEAVRAFTDRPFVLFGHSMGAWVAFEVAVRLERAGGARPDTLVVSGMVAPTDWAAHRAVPPRAADSDDDLLDWLRRESGLPAEVLADEELREMAVFLLRTDLCAADHYRYAPGTVLATPIEVLHGVSDTEVGVAAVRRWAALTAGRCRITPLPGGHFYADGLWPVLPRHVAAMTKGEAWAE